MFNILPLIYNRITRYINSRKIITSCPTASVGLKTAIIGKMMIKVDSSCVINIGNNVIITNGRDYNPLSPNSRGTIFMSPNSQLYIGDLTGMSSPHIWVKNKILIGKNVNIGADCIILDNDCHSLDFKIRRHRKIENNGFTPDYNSSFSSPITIEDDVLIGTRSIILKGVTIGSRSVIGAGSVVTRNIPADCIAGGNPCKVIRKINE